MIGVKISIRFFFETDIFIKAKKIEKSKKYEKSRNSFEMKKR